MDAGVDAQSTPIASTPAPPDALSAQLVAINPSLLPFVRMDPAQRPISASPSTDQAAAPADNADAKAPQAAANSGAPSTPSSAPVNAAAADTSSQQATAQAAATPPAPPVAASSDRTTMRPTARTASSGSSGSDRTITATASSTPATGAVAAGDAKALVLADADQAAGAATPGNQAAEGDGDTASADGGQPTALAAGAQIPTAASPQIAVPAAVAASAAASASGAEITAQLAAQVARRASAGSSRFDFALDPQGLGRVDVSLKIDSTGQLSATFAFDNSATAADAKNRAGELQQALQQAGFDVSQSNLSFTTGGQGQGSGWQDAPVHTYARATPMSDAGLPDLPAISLAAAATSVAGAIDITI
jgi:flagellar hook-length control protein FliK